VFKAQDSLTKNQPQPAREGGPRLRRPARETRPRKLYLGRLWCNLVLFTLTAAAILPSRSPLEGIADLLDSLPTQSCVELIHRLLTMAFTLSAGESRPKAVLKIVILFLAEYDSAA